ncbi:MAG: hypothetical protein M1826_005570 [Phylliscum demangeonii]|nr:MAG: hypothetical protein M1826_005570 [Phylliscum demangeonii]
MTSAVAKYVSTKILGESAKNHFGKEDPYFEQVPATRLDGRPSKKTKKRRKALPPGISECDGKVLTKAKRRAYILDMGFSFCGIRFGWGSIIGLIPAFGDCMDLFMAAMVIKTCAKVEGGLPRDVYQRMLFNVILDFVVGLVPFLGDIADVFYRCNTRNVVILEKYLREKGARAAAAAAPGLPARVTDPSLPEEFDRAQAEEHGDPPEYETMQGVSRPPQPLPATTRRDTARNPRWFGWGRRAASPPDLEGGGNQVSSTRAK